MKTTRHVASAKASPSKLAMKPMLLALATALILVQSAQAQITYEKLLASDGAINDHLGINFS